MQSNNTLKIIIIALAVLLIGTLAYAFWPAANNTGSTQNNTGTSTSTEDEQVVCTMDAKLCPDGSYVGRTGPNCEFAPCPAAINTDSWKTATNTKVGISFKYPAALDTKYISVNSVDDWPPKIEIINKPFTCEERIDDSSAAEQTMRREIAGVEYCVSEEVEGAAGSAYHEYKYTFAKDNKTVQVSFTLRFSGCPNYNEPQKTECEKEQASFNIDNLLKEMVKTVQIK